MVADNWPFNEPKNIGCITTKQIMDLGFPILAILHDVDGAWQVLCETAEDSNDGMLVGLNCLYAKFPMLEQFADMPRGYEAVRESENSEWVISESVYED